VHKLAHGLLHILFGDGADLALNLCDDHIGLECLQLVRKDAVDRESFLKDRLDPLVDLIARSFNIELGFRALRELFDPLGTVALMTPSHELIAEPQGTYDLRAAGDEGDDAMEAHGKTVSSKGPDGNRGSTAFLPPIYFFTQPVNT